MCRILGPKTVVAFGGFPVGVFLFLGVWGGFGSCDCFFFFFSIKGWRKSSPIPSTNITKSFNPLVQGLCSPVYLESAPCCALLQYKSSCSLECSLRDLGSLPLCQQCYLIQKLQYVGNRLHTKYQHDQLF